MSALQKYLAQLAARHPEVAEAGEKAMKLHIYDAFAKNHGSLLAADASKKIRADNGLWDLKYSASEPAPIGQLTDKLSHTATSKNLANKIRERVKEADDLSPVEQPRLRRYKKLKDPNR